MKNCAFCEKPLVQRPREANSYFANRMFCGNPCRIKGRRAGVIKGPVGELSYDEIRAIARAKALTDGSVAGAKLTPDDVRSIRELVSVLGFSHLEVAKFKGLRRQTVERIMRGETWVNVT